MDNMVSAARIRAVQFGLEPALVCAVIEQESSWQPWAIRFEPGFREKYVEPLRRAHQLKTFGASAETESVLRSCSFGLMQTMGQVAREEGLEIAFLSELCNPERGLEVGCSHLAMKLELAKGDVEKALLLWNGGANPAYSREVLARIPSYR
jgi:soluble lytic murein transglycosylase-like protein